MADLTLTFAMTPYDRVQSLMSGEVKPEGIALEYSKYYLKQKRWWKTKSHGHDTRRC